MFDFLGLRGTRYPFPRDHHHESDLSSGSDLSSVLSSRSRLLGGVGSATNVRRFLRIEQERLEMLDVQIANNAQERMLAMVVEVSKTQAQLDNVRMPNRDKNLGECDFIWYKASDQVGDNNEVSDLTISGVESHIF